MIGMQFTDNQIYKNEASVLVTNSDHFITSVSSPFCKRFNVKEEDWLGKSIKNIITISQRIKHEKIMYCTLFNQASLIKLSLHEDKKIYQVLLTDKDISRNELVSFINALDSKKYKKTSINNRYFFHDIIGKSPAMSRVKELAEKIAMNHSTILLTGESGTGKELFAQAIHGLSSRKDHPFIAVNCIAIPDELFESELFGYEAGAFSGAKTGGKPGKIELAQYGTLFLDEISELSFQAQGKLLRVLQEREVERLGGTTRKQVDIRIIAATNRDLKQMVSEGKFREDLFYRLYVFDLLIPPLRSRKEDILPLVHHFIEEYNHHFGKEVIYIDSELEDWLLTYEWPGNVRELKASIERGMNIVEGDTLSLEHIYLRSPQIKRSEKPRAYSSLEEAVQHAEIQAIQQALKKANGDRALAAQYLQIHVASLYRKIAKYDLR